MDSNEFDEQQVSIVPALKVFIQSNYHQLTMDELVQYTQLSPEVINNVIDEIEASMMQEESQHNPREKEHFFSFTIHVEEDGAMSIQALWPPANKLNDSTELLARFFYSLGSGKLKPYIVQYLQKMAIEQGALKFVAPIMEKWGSLISINEGEAALIEADEVFNQQ